MASEDVVRPRRSLSKQGKGKKQQVVAKKDQDKWVFFVKDELVSTENGAEESQATICQIRHPRRDEGLMFILSPDCKTVSEVNSFKEQYRSWFIGNTIHSDGQIYMSTPVDPIFLVLPYLITASSSKRFMALDQIVCDEELPDCQKLLSCSGLDHLFQVADVKDVDEDLKVYRYNAEKTLSWLRAKTEAAADVLREKKVNISSGGSQSAMFVRSKKIGAASREEYIAFAFGMISEYLPLRLEAALQDHLGLKEKQLVSSEDVTTENEPPAKKPKMEEGVLEDYSLKYDLKKEKSATKLTVAQKKLSKVDKSGMKSISSFFSKKA